jgi:hypothetical protein
MSRNLTILEMELSAILTITSIPMALGGGNHGHAGIIIDPATYFNMTGKIDFINPGNPRI